jgi:hypothetical protein
MAPGRHRLTFATGEFSNANAMEEFTTAAGVLSEHA